MTTILIYSVKTCGSGTSCPMMTSSNGNGLHVTGPFSVTGGFPSQRASNAGFDVYFDVSLNKRTRRRWLEKPSRSLWRHCIALRVFLVGWGVNWLCYNVKTAYWGHLKRDSWRPIIFRVAHMLHWAISIGRECLSSLITTNGIKYL